MVPIPHDSRTSSNTRQSFTPAIDYATSSRRIHDRCIFPYVACCLYGALLEHHLQHCSIVMRAEYGVKLLVGWLALDALFPLAGVDDMINCSCSLGSTTR